MIVLTFNFVLRGKGLDKGYLPILEDLLSFDGLEFSLINIFRKSADKRGKIISFMYD